MIFINFINLKNLKKTISLSKIELAEILNNIKENLIEMLKRNGLSKIVLPDLQGLENATTFGKRFGISAQKVNKILQENNLIRKNENKEYELTEEGRDIGFVVVTQVIKASKENCKKITVDSTFSLMLKVEFEEKFRQLLEQSENKEVIGNEEK